MKGKRERASGRPRARRAGLGRALTGGLIVGGLVYGGVELRRYAMKSPRFALVEVEVEGARRSTVERVRAASGLQRGANVFASDVDAAVERVEALPWVASATARRLLPDRVTLTVVEHEPVALLALESLYYVNRQGAVFRAYHPGEPIELPVVMGVDRDGFRYGDPEAMGRVRTALDFLDAWREVRGAAAGRPAEIEVSAPGLVRFTAPGGTSVWAGRAPWQGVLRRLGPLLDRIGRGEEDIEELYAGRGRRADRVVVQRRAAGPGAEER